MVCSISCAVILSNDVGHDFGNCLAYMMHGQQNFGCKNVTKMCQHSWWWSKWDLPKVENS